MQPSKKKNITHAFFILPSLVLYIIFCVYPIFSGAYYSLTNWNGITKKFKFIGLDNYAKMFHDTRFLKAALFTVKYTVVLIVFVLLISLLIGNLLDGSIKGKAFWKSVYFFPAVISMIACGLVFDQIFAYGLPQIGDALNVESLKKSILTGRDTAWIGIVTANIWRGCAIPIILVISGLQTVPGEILESVSLDGANDFQKFWHIKLPYLFPVLSMILVLILKEGLMVYDYITVLTGGGPAGATESITYLLYNLGFQEMKFSYAIAQAVVVAIVIIFVSIIQITVIDKKRIY